MQMTPLLLHHLIVQLNQFSLLTTSLSVVRVKTEPCQKKKKKRVQWALAGLLARVTGLSGSHSMDLRHDQDPGNLYWTWESRRGQLAASAGGSPVQDLLSLAQWVRRLKSRRKGWVYLLTYWLLDPYGVTILLAFSGCVELDWELLPSFYCDLFKAWTALQSSWSPTAGFQVPCGGWPLSHLECLM